MLINNYQGKKISKRIVIISAVLPAKSGVILKQD
jgi:hypothetical protein